MFRTFQTPLVYVNLKQAPVKCETKQKRNGTKRNEANRLETKQIETKRNKTKRNRKNRNRTKQMKYIFCKCMRLTFNLNNLMPHRNT